MNERKKNVVRERDYYTGLYNISDGAIAAIRAWSTKQRILKRKVEDSEMNRQSSNTSPL